MRNKGFFAAIFIVCIVSVVFLINDYVKAQEINIEILIDGVDDVPKVGRIGEPVSVKLL